MEGKSMRSGLIHRSHIHRFSAYIVQDMNRNKRTVGHLARNYRIVADDALVLLWYCGKKFNYLKNENSVIKQKDLGTVRQILNDHSCKGQKKILKTPATILKNKTYDFTIGEIIDSIRFLTLDEVSFIHHELAKDLSSSGDPIAPAGVRDLSLLESALHHPQTSFGGKRKYPTIESSAAALMYAISNNHPFHNGNKRTALVALLVHLDRYNFSLTCDEDDLFRLSLEVADHNIEFADSKDADAEVHALANWIFENSKKIKKGERPITKKRLLHILQDFECAYNENTGRFERDVESRSFWRGMYKEKLTFKIPLSEIRHNDTIDKGVMNTLRKALRLDAEHGIDQEAFYGGAKFSASEFINKYSKLLNRLSKR